MKYWLILLLLWTTAILADETCMVSPTKKQVVSGRFGKFRGGGAANHGSANTKPHMHDGLDFSTSGVSHPLYASTDGIITSIGSRGTAGNAILIKRSSGDIVAYYHMSGFANGLTKGSAVKAGQYIGLSGNTPSTSMAKHLHFTYGTTARDQARAKAFTNSARKGAFNPGQLAFVFRQQIGIGWKTDPAPYFCNTFPIVDGNPAQRSILGDDTKEQHQILFGDIPPGGVEPNIQFDTAQVEAANQDVSLANAENKTAPEWLSDSDGYGTLPSPPIGDYETMSAREMMMTEATRRFTDAEWNNNVTKVSSRALWVDFLKAQGVTNFMNHAIYEKKEKVEALLATYVSQRLDGMRQRVKDAHERALHDETFKIVR